MQLQVILYQYWFYEMNVYFTLFDVYPFTFWFLNQRPISNAATMPFHMRVGGSYEVYGLDLEIQHREYTKTYTTSVYTASTTSTWTPVYGTNPDFDYMWWDPYWRFQATDIPGLSGAVASYYGAHVLFDNTLF